MNRLAAIALAAALAGCRSSYELPEEPEPGPAASPEENQEIVQLVATLGAEDPKARTGASARLEEIGLAAVPWLFAGAEDSDPERAQASREVLARFRRKSWETTPPTDEEFVVRLQRSVRTGHSLRVFAFWWVARIARVEEARRTIPDPGVWLRDDDPEVRRYAAVLHIRFGMDVRRLADLLPDALEQILRSRGELEEWEEVLISLCAATFEEAELVKVRMDLRDFVRKARSADESLAWWEVRSFFRRAGPAAEPLLRDILLNEEPGDLRRLAAVSYGPGSRTAPLLAAWKTGPNDDLAIALGNSGRPEPAPELVRLLAASKPDSLDRWAAELALERATGKWLGDASDKTDAAAARWRAAVEGGSKNIHLSIACDDGGAFLATEGGESLWEVGVGPLDQNRIVRIVPGWAVFHAPALDPSTAAADLLAAWRLNNSAYLLLLDFMAMGSESARPRAERMIARALAAAAGTQPGPTLEATVEVIREVRDPLNKRDRGLLADSSAPEEERRLAARRLAFGGAEDASALAAFAASKPSPASRAAAYLTLFQIGDETAFLALAANAADQEAKIMYGGFPDSAACLLLRVRFIEERGLEECDANERDPEKWARTVRAAFAKK
ncbi:MAG: hypothetical protein HYY18_14080 [Planctomycetes bacterium]|nr:hypothetical protein [Planctomycetota bacterium]